MEGSALDTHVSLDGSWLTGHSDEMRHAWNDMPAEMVPEAAQVDLSGDIHDSSYAQISAPFGLLSEAEFDQLKLAVSSYLRYHLPAKILAEAPASEASQVCCLQVHSQRERGVDAYHMYF